MKALILAAGKSTRTHPLTVGRPKALLEVAGTTIIEHNLQQLQGIVDEVVIVVGFGAGHINEIVGNSYGRLKVSYVVQKAQLGTGSAVLAAEGNVSGRFVILMGDDLYSASDIKTCVKRGYSILGKDVIDVSIFGAVVEKGGFLQLLKEKPEGGRSGVANAALYVVDDRIFSILKKVKKSSRGEYELTDAVTVFAGSEKVAVETASFWVPITYPWSLLDANEALLSGISRKIRGKVEKGAAINGNVSIGRNTLIRSGAYIEGPAVIGENCDIGPNCRIRPSTSIGNNCRVGNACEVKNSIVMDGTHIGHLSYVGDSVLGENVNLGAGTVVANLRHDNSPVKSMVNGRLVDSGRRKLGAVMGVNAKTGVNTSIYPGRKIWPNKTTLPGEVVRKDVA